MAKYTNQYTVQDAFRCYALTRNAITPSLDRSIDEKWYAILKSEPPSYIINEKEIDDAMNIHAANASQAYQYGAAMAHYVTGQWKLLSAMGTTFVLRHERPSGNEDYLVTDGHKHTAMMYVGNSWQNVEYLKPLVRKYLNGYSAEPGRALGSPLEICQNVAAFLSAEERANAVTPWTFYHVLASKLAKQRINFVRDREIRVDVHRNLTEGYRKALWELAGFHHAEFPLRLDRFTEGPDGKLYVRQYPKGIETLTPVVLRKGLSVFSFLEKARL
jgi:hypothetical protein